MQRMSIVSQTPAAPLRNVRALASSGDIRASHVCCFPEPRAAPLPGEYVEAASRCAGLDAKSVSPNDENAVVDDCNAKWTKNLEKIGLIIVVFIP